MQTCILVSEEGTETSVISGYPLNHHWVGFFSPSSCSGPFKCCTPTWMLWFQRSYTKQQWRKASPCSLCFLSLPVHHFISSFKRWEACVWQMDAFFSFNLFWKFPFLRSKLWSRHLFCIAGFELLRPNVSGKRPSSAYMQSKSAQIPKFKCGLACSDLRLLTVYSIKCVVSFSKCVHF